MTQPFTLPLYPAGSSPLISQIYSEQRLNKDVVDALEAKLSLILPQKSNNTVLIIGGKCGLTTELLIPFCSRIDIVEQEPYLQLLKERFINHRDVKYTFTKEGQLGQECIRPKPDLLNCKINVYEMQSFEKHNQGQNCYNVILLQNVLINEKMNILEELMRIQHEVLITMLNPGKIVHENLFELLAGIQKNILTIFYEHIVHQRLQNARYITGRKQQLLFWEIFIWKKKPAGQEGSLHIIHQIRQILKKEIEQNIIKKKRIESGIKSYETVELFNIYKQFHWSDEEFFTVKNFAKTCAIKAIDIAKQENLSGRALDIGCAFGRTTIQLASHFDEVIGLDLSHNLIQGANEVLNTKFSDLKKKVKFVEGDACKLDKSLGKFSFIFGGNLIDRLYDPEAFLVQVSQFLELNGVLMLCSPYSWLEEFTPKQKWIGGFKKDGKIVTSYEGLNQILSKNGFKQAQQPQDVRFVMQENPWVFQYTLANVTFWKKIQ